MTIAEIEKKIAELNAEKEKLEKEQRNKLSKERESRKKELKDAYDAYMKLKEKFDEDYNACYYPTDEEFFYSLFGR